ncbi:MAG: AmmeMemoRadiSam system protein B [Lentisphaerae bacterium]|nr:AmmeMemoRadiSam system protein B [Lentisphaerota bacterium]
MHTTPQRVIQAAGAGRWFPGERAALQSMVEAWMDDITTPAPAERIAAAISPHAGYVYSGPVTAHVFHALREQARRGLAPDTLIILGFSHSRGFAGVAVMDADALATPLGPARLDTEAARLLTGHSDRIFFDNRPHRGEHSAENQIPFAQAALPETLLLPLIIGDHDYKTRATLLKALEQLAATKKIAVIASSDMLHDPDYDLVTRTDHQTLEKTTAMDTEALLTDWQPQHQIYCGISAVAVALEFARQQGCREGRMLHYRNSGDDHPESRGQWVVGYGAVIFLGAAAD